MRRFGLLSLGLHAALLAGVLLWMRHGGAPTLQAPDEAPTVELVMLEQKGSGPTTVAPTPPPPEAPAETKPAAAAEPPSPPPPPPPPAAEATEEPLPPLPPPPPPPTRTSSAAAPRPQPAAPEPPPPPAINLGGTDSETNAIVTGEQVMPARADASYHNKEPVYPPDAVRRAEQGAVFLVIHVSPQGLASGVDIMKSSGYLLLDRTAREAVAQWHFLPAVKDGKPIPSDMALRVIFRLD